MAKSMDEKDGGPLLSQISKIQRMKQVLTLTLCFFYALGDDLSKTFRHLIVINTHSNGFKYILEFFIIVGNGD